MSRNSVTTRKKLRTTQKKLAKAKKDAARKLAKLPKDTAQKVTAAKKNHEPQPEVVKPLEENKQVLPIKWPPKLAR